MIHISAMSKAHNAGKAIARRGNLFVFIFKAKLLQPGRHSVQPA
jgi:hypothetical protein